MNDPHYSRHEPECRGPDFNREVLAKFHQVAALARKVKATAICCTGDWFHRKGKVTFHEANDMLAVMSGWRVQGFQVAGILGNHDIAGHSLDSMDNRAVGTMVHSRSLHLLDKFPLELEDQEGKVYLTGTSYFHGNDKDDDARIKAYGHHCPHDRDSGWVHVHLAHGTLVQKGEFFEDYTVAGELVGVLADAEVLPDVIACGHLHYNEGVKNYDVDGRTVKVARVGSLTRVSRDDLDRTPLALLIVVKDGRVLTKTFPIEVEAVTILSQEREDPRSDYEERIKEFVRVLREEADAFSLLDNQTLLEQVAKELGHPEEILNMAIAAVDKRA